jgi:hypothetical protein
MRLALILALCLVTQESIQAEAFLENSNYSKEQVSVEILGTGGYYSFYGSYRLARNISVNAGGSYFRFVEGLAPAGASKIDAFYLPISVSYLMGDDYHYIEVMGGLTLSLLTGDGQVSRANRMRETFSSQTVIPEIGVGYRYWPRRGGLTYRLMGYMLFASNQTQPWGGLSMGYAF